MRTITLTWTCEDQDCGREDIPETETECPVCGFANPSVITLNADEAAGA